MNKETIGKNRAGSLQESTTPPGHAARKNTRDQSETQTLLLYSCYSTKNGALKVWMKWNSELALHFIGRLPLPCPRRLPLPNNLPLRGNGLLSGLVARVWGGQPGQRAVPQLALNYEEFIYVTRLGWNDTEEKSHQVGSCQLLSSAVTMWGLAGGVLHLLLSSNFTSVVNCNRVSVRVVTASLFLWSRSF